MSNTVRKPTCKLIPPLPLCLAGLAPLATAVLAVPLEPMLPGLRMPPPAPPIGSELKVKFEAVCALVQFTQFYQEGSLLGEEVS